MEDMTQYLVELGKTIARTHHDTGENMSQLVVKTASAENLNADTRQELIAWANKSYIDLYGVHEFDIATPEEVTRISYSEPSNVMTKVAYKYPELYSKPGGQVSKTASSGEELKFDRSKDMRKMLSQDAHTLFTKYAKLHNAMEPVYADLQQNIDLLKTLGVTSSEIRASADYPFISEIYNKSPKVKTAFAQANNYAISKYMDEVSTGAKQLARLAVECKDTYSALKMKQASLAKLKKLGKVYI